jgi:hypothetical protein
VSVCVSARVIMNMTHSHTHTHYSINRFTLSTCSMIISLYIYLSFTLSLTLSHTHIHTNTHTHTHTDVTRRGDKGASHRRWCACSDDFDSCFHTRIQGCPTNCTVTQCHKERVTLVLATVMLRVIKEKAPRLPGRMLASF